MRNAVIVGYKRSPFTFARKGEMANICLLYTSDAADD